MIFYIPWKDSISDAFIKPSIVFLLILSPLLSQSQNFVNPDLNGSVFSYSALPDNWDNVEASDPICLASNANIGDTPDLCTPTQPNIDDGVGGIAFSGNTFLCGLRMNGISVDFHEGIQQTVNGFTIGETYNINFNQTVTKQVFALDQTGSWAVYKESDLIGISDPSTSLLAFDDPNLIWEERTLSFTATATSHTFKFLPWDDDTNLQSSLSDTQAALRMGIDQITINNDCALDLGPNLTVCTDDFPIEIGTSLVGTYSWNTGDTSGFINVADSGNYVIEVNSSCGLLSDSIYIAIEETLSPVDLGVDITVCPDDFPLTLTADVTGTYLWNTFETAQSISINSQGLYSVAVSNTCGTVFDEITITTLAGEPSVNLGADLFLCVEDFPVELDAGIQNTYDWSSGESTQTIIANNPGDFAVTVGNSCGTASDQITLNLITPPNPVSLGNSISVCENQFPVVLEINPTDDDILWSTGSVQEQISLNTGGTYDVTVSNQCGLTNASIDISAIPNPTAAEDITICDGEFENFLGVNYFEAGTYSVVQPTSMSGDCDTFWEVNVNVIPIDTVNVYLELSEGETIEYEGNYYSEGGIYYYNQEVADACNYFLRVFVEEEDELFVYVPSAFTPNDDGINDLFQPVLTLVGDFDITEFEFEIYDRYGHSIYQSMNYENASWNGKNPKNENYYVQDGIYNWTLSYSTSSSADKTQEKGTVLMSR